MGPTIEVCVPTDRYTTVSLGVSGCSLLLSMVTSNFPFTVRWFLHKVNQGARWDMYTHDDALHGYSRAKGCICTRELHVRLMSCPEFHRPFFFAIHPSLNLPGEVKCLACGQIVSLAELVFFHTYIHTYLTYKQKLGTLLWTVHELLEMMRQLERWGL